MHTKKVSRLQNYILSRPEQKQHRIFIKTASEFENNFGHTRASITCVVGVEPKVAKQEAIEAKTAQRY